MSQLVLPLDGHDELALDATLEGTPERVGPNAVIRGELLGHDEDVQCLSSRPT